MINCLNLLGASRSGKTALVPLLTAIPEIDLPFNTPDLDWYVEAYLSGAMSAETSASLCAQYMMCYSWYSYLGRHINQRKSDYYSLKRLKPKFDEKIFDARADSDESFKEFLSVHKKGQAIGFFTWDMPPQFFDILSSCYPLNMKQIFCYRSPLSLVEQWISSDRVRRSESFSRMFKYNSLKNLKRGNLIEQFLMNERNQSEITVKNKKYNWNKVSVDQYGVSDRECDVLLSLVQQQKKEALFWKKNGLVISFERIVSEPEKIISKISENLGVYFSSKNTDHAIDLMNKRPLKEVLLTDESEIKSHLEAITENRFFRERVFELQMDYVRGF